MSLAPSFSTGDALEDELLDNCNLDQRPQAFASYSAILYGQFGNGSRPSKLGAQCIPTIGVLDNQVREVRESIEIAANGGPISGSAVFNSD